MHEAHNLKLYDLQAAHDRAIKALQEELKASNAKSEELQQDLSRKAMEIQYLEQDQEESQEQVTRYVRFFGIKYFIGSIIALATIWNFF